MLPESAIRRNLQVHVSRGQRVFSLEILAIGENYGKLGPFKRHAYETNSITPAWSEGMKGMLEKKTQEGTFHGGKRT